MSMTDEQIKVDLFNQVKELQSQVQELEVWKTSAMVVLNDWEKVWVAAEDRLVLWAQTSQKNY